MERIPPFAFIHVLDNNTSVTRVVTGPATFARQEHEQIVCGPLPMIVLPPRHYVRIRNPCERDAQNKPLEAEYGVKLRHDDVEIRFSEVWPEPFPLYPGEEVEQVAGKSVIECKVVAVDTALRLRAQRDFNDCLATEEGKMEEVARVAGDEWLFRGPGTYKPQVEVQDVETVVAKVIQPNHALRLRARRAFKDRYGSQRKVGEEWLIRDHGSFLPDVDEHVVGEVQPVILTPERSLLLRATREFTDVYNVRRKAGEEWLVTHVMATPGCFHIPDVDEHVLDPAVRLVTLGESEYVIVLNPLRNGKNQYGAQELRRGPTSFFLMPGEELDTKQHQPTEVKSKFVLGDGEALLLKAKEGFQDADFQRTPGDLWMIEGPRDYVPPVEVEVVELRKEIPLDANEGIYVRNVQTGHIRAMIGETYLLNSHEVLWEKELPKEVEELLDWSYYKGRNGVDPKRQARDRTRVVVFRVPHNAAVQVYDYSKRRSRVVFGPQVVMLGPDEQFTLLSLSGDKPKRPDVIHSLALMLGPDFMTDVIEVETSDHARLRLQISYNWHFAVLPEEESKELSEEDRVQAAGAKLFNVRDFVGDACQALASRIRGAVAQTSFDTFHKQSARLIRRAVFGEVDGHIGDVFHFHANNLFITNVDIQSVEPSDVRTRESLQKSVQLAIEITTRQQERNARHQAQETEQVAEGEIAMVRIQNQKGAEEEKQALVELQAQIAAMQSTGQAKAEAEAKAEYLAIEAQADVDQAQLMVEARTIEAIVELEELVAAQNLDLDHQKALDELEVDKQDAISQIEAMKFEKLVAAMKPETLRAIALAGPELQSRLLKGLGLKGYLLTDGSSPVNLFNAAKGMVGGNAGAAGNVQFQ